MTPGPLRSLSGTVSTNRILGEQDEGSFCAQQRDEETMDRSDLQSTDLKIRHTIVDSNNMELGEDWTSCPISYSYGSRLNSEHFVEVYADRPFSVNFVN